MKKVVMFLILAISSVMVFGQVTDTLRVSDYIFGDLTINKMLAGYVMAIVGALIRWLVLTKRAVEENERTPSKFNVGYWLRDNALPKLTSLFGSALMTFVIFRFAEQYIGQALSMGGALGVGLGWDYLVDKLKKMQPDVAINKIQGTAIN